MKKNLIVGSNYYREIDGKTFVNRRSIEMIRLFYTPQLESTLVLFEENNDETLNYELEHDEVTILKVSKEYVVKYKLFRPNLGNKLPDILSNAIKNVDIVYLRIPSWVVKPVFYTAKKENKNVVVSVHGDWAEGYKVSEERSFIRGVFKRIMAEYVNVLVKSIIKKSSYVFFVGKQLKNRYSSLNGNNIVMANFLFTKEEIFVREHQSLDRIPRIIFVGRLEEYKGVKVLLKSVSILKEKNRPVHLSIVGEGRLKDNLVSMTEKLGINDLVDFKGYFQYGSLLLEEYRKSEIFILPSISSEGMPKVVLEAMSQGTVVIATDIGSTRYLLENNNGILITSNSPEAICEAVEKLMDNESLCEDLRNNGYEFAKTQTKEVQIQKIRKGWSEAIKLT